MPIEICHPDSNRIGKINLPYAKLNNGAERPMLRALFSLCTKLDEYEHESGRGHEFILASDLFQPLNEGEEIPHYRVEMTCRAPFEQEDHQARRIDAGDFSFVAIRQQIIRVPTVTVGVHLKNIH